MSEKTNTYGKIRIGHSPRLFESIAMRCIYIYMHDVIHVYVDIYIYVYMSTCIYIYVFMYTGKYVNII